MFVEPDRVLCELSVCNVTNLYGISSVHCVAQLATFFSYRIVMFMFSVGIVRHLNGILPLGATDRVVFEGICFSCTGEDFDDMKYRWYLTKRPLKHLLKDQVRYKRFSEKQTRAKISRTDKKNRKLPDHIDTDEFHIDWITVLKTLRNITLNSNYEFLPRFRNYREFSHKNIGYSKEMKNTIFNKVPPISNATNDSTSNIFAFQKLSESQSDESNNYFHKMPRSVAKLTKDKNAKGASDIFGTYYIDQENSDLKTVPEILPSSSMRYDKYFLEEREDVEMVEKLVGKTIDRAAIKQARELYDKSQRRRREIYRHGDTQYFKAKKPRLKRGISDQDSSSVAESILSSYNATGETSHIGASGDGRMAFSPSLQSGKFTVKLLLLLLFHKHF